MKFCITKRIFLVLICLISFNAFGDDQKSNRIEVLVNEDIITKYDVIQRLKINSILKRIEINESNYKNFNVSFFRNDIIQFISAQLAKSSRGQKFNCINWNYCIFVCFFTSYNIRNIKEDFSYYKE